MPDWISEWKSQVLPLRRQHGFEVVGSWTVHESEKFVWILRYDGADSWEEAEQAYYNSPARKAMDPDPARHIEHNEHWLMRELRL